MLVILTNIPTPYRTAFFDALQSQCESRGEGFFVLYCAETEPRRLWGYRPDEMRHPHKILPGFHPRRGSAVFHLNFAVLAELKRLQPTHLLVAGAWNTPTMLLSTVKWLTPSMKRYFWSEGHADAALHKEGLIAKVRRWAYRRFDGFAVPNEKSAQWALSQSGGKGCVLKLPNSVNAPFFTRKDEKERGEARQRLGLAQDIRILVQVAALEPRKSPLELSKAFLGLKSEERGKALLVLVGSGPLESEVKNLISESQSAVRVTGHVTQPQVRDWLMAANVFVLNTRQDPNPLAPIEASCASLPVAMSIKAGNIKELVIDPKAGWAIENPNDPSDVLRKVLACSDVDLRQQGERAYQHAVQTFAATSAANSLLTQLNSI